MNILLVDDNHTNRKLLALTLQAEGHQILHAANGVEALQLLGTQSVEAIIADVLMPLMDGYQLCNTIRATRRFKQIPFVFYSSHYATEEGEKFGLEAGADRYLHKPASTFSILAALYDVIREKSDGGSNNNSAPANTNSRPRRKQPSGKITRPTSRTPKAPDA